MITTETLGELLRAHGGSIKTGPFGTVLKASEYSESGVPIISVGEVGYGALSLRNDTPRAAENVTERLPEYVLQKGDIVFGRKGAVDRSAWVKASEDGWFLGSDGIRVRLPSVVDSRFVAYQFQTEATKTWLLQHASGSTMLSLNQKILERVPLNLPSRAEQEAIADSLAALDDKIAANSRLISKCDEVLEATFVLLCGNSDQTVPFTELVTITKGVSYRSVDLRESSTALVTLKSFNRNGGYSLRGLKDYAGPFKDAQEIAPGELVVAQTDLTQAAEVVGRAVRVPEAPGYQKLIASLDLAIIRPRMHIPVEFILGVMLQGRFRAHCRSRTTGTTVLHLASDAIPTFLAPLVPGDMQVNYAGAARPILELRDSLESEMNSLASIRDALLPQLMSGKLRVKDAEMALEKVGV